MTPAVPEFAGSIKVSALNAQHPDYTLYLEAWQGIDDICASGAVLRKKASQYLVKRPREVAEVYNERVKSFTHQDILGTALGWYNGAMFRDEPTIALSAPDDFYTRFLDDCNRNGTSLVNLFSAAFGDVLKFRTSYLLLDLPKPGDAYSTLAEQKAVGALDPYLVSYDPRAAINWECDAYGNLEWIIFAVVESTRKLGEPSATVDKWYYFNRQHYAVYEHERKADGEPGDAVARLSDFGFHALASAGLVPVVRFEIPQNLWLGNRGYLGALRHLNALNALNWGLDQACLAQLYVKGAYQDDMSRSEVGYLQIEEGGEIGYVEPSGVSFKIAADNIDNLREEIYRQMYLQAQGRSSTATASASSGYSKQMDMAPSRDVLNALGDRIRAAMRRVLEYVALVRGDKITADVRGFQFDDGDEDAELATAQLAEDLDIPSDTLEKEVQKRVARKLLKDAPPDLVAKVEGEIDAAPSKSARAQAAGSATQARIGTALQSGLQKFETRAATAAL